MRRPRRPRRLAGSRPVRAFDARYAPPPARPPAGSPPTPAGRRRPGRLLPPASPAAGAARAGRPPRRRPPGRRQRPRRTREPTPLPTGDSPYVTPLVRKLAAEHAVPLEAISGTGVGGRIRKQDVLEAARAQRAAEAAAARRPPPPQPRQPAAAAAQPPAAPQPPAARLRAAAGPPAAAPAPRPALVPSALRGTTQRMSRPRQVIAKRMVESLQTSAQLTTVVEADVTNIARLRDRAKAASRPARASS